MTENKTTKMKNLSLIAGLVSTGIAVLLVVAAVCLGYRRHIKRQSAKQVREAAEGTKIPLDGDMDDEFEKGTGPRRFTSANCHRRHTDSPTTRSSVRGVSDRSTMGTCRTRGSM